MRPSREGNPRCFSWIRAYEKTNDLLHFDFESTGRGGEKKGTFSQSGGVWGESGQLFANGGEGAASAAPSPRALRILSEFSVFLPPSRVFFAYNWLIVRCLCVNDSLCKRVLNIFVLVWCTACCV